MNLEPQEIVKLTGSAVGAACVLSGIVALFRGLKADGEIDISALLKGKIKTGSAGVILLFFGGMLIVAPILKGSNLYTEKYAKGSRVGIDARDGRAEADVRQDWVSREVWDASNNWTPGSVPDEPDSGTANETHGQPKTPHRASQAAKSRSD